MIYWRLHHKYYKHFGYFYKQPKIVQLNSIDHILVATTTTKPTNSRPTTKRQQILNRQAVNMLLRLTMCLLHKVPCHNVTADPTLSVLSMAEWHPPFNISCHTACDWKKKSRIPYRQITAIPLPEHRLHPSAEEGEDASLNTLSPPVLNGKVSLCCLPSPPPPYLQPLYILKPTPSVLPSAPADWYRAGEEGYSKRLNDLRALFHWHTCTRWLKQHWSRLAQ